MSNDENKRSGKASFRSAPDVGAFYFEDAFDILARSGFDIGYVDIALPPRHMDETDSLNDIKTHINNYATENRAPRGDCQNSGRGLCGLPAKKYRVIRCLENGISLSGAPKCDLVIVAENGLPVNCPGDIGEPAKAHSYDQRRFRNKHRDKGAG